MNGDDFIHLVKKYVRDVAVSDTIESLETASTKGSPAEIKRSEWFRKLSDDERKNVNAVVLDAANAALFGLFCVLDGVRAVEKSAGRGTFVLLHKGKNGAEIILNDPAQEFLHDVFNRESDS